MKFLALFTLLLLWSCNQKNEPKNTATSDPKTEVQKEIVVEQVEDREPLVDMINVEFDSGKSKYSAWIQDRDAKYYLVDGGYGSDLSFSLEGGHPAIQLIVINPKDEMVYRQNLNGTPVKWDGKFDESGRFTFIVQLDSKLSDKNQIRTLFNVEIEKEGI